MKVRLYWFLGVKRKNLFSCLSYLPEPNTFASHRFSVLNTSESFHTHLCKLLPPLPTWRSLGEDIDFNGSLRMVSIVKNGWFANSTPPTALILFWEMQHIHRLQEYPHWTFWGALIVYYTRLHAVCQAPSYVGTRVIEDKTCKDLVIRGCARLGRKNRNEVPNQSTSDLPLIWKQSEEEKGGEGSCASLLQNHYMPIYSSTSGTKARVCSSDPRCPCF